MKDPVEAHFPNVTMELVSEVVDSQPLQETFAQGIVPDYSPGSPGLRRVEGCGYALPA
ncbi:hypothetical protein ABEX25_26200 [Paenibacillus thiaminolyticus]|uniref:hypothetical protein n=1 Tax=Paenibacillus thiaminolyticus TaxID=49283 RepID=UPI003D2E00F2